MEQGELMLEVEACDGLVEKQHLSRLDRPAGFQCASTRAKWTRWRSPPDSVLVVAVGEMGDVCLFQRFLCKELAVTSR